MLMIVIKLKERSIRDTYHKAVSNNMYFFTQKHITDDDDVFSFILA
jgi:hypothetical protein